jgi:3-deoxy-D-manno-octulosonic-acid transferase
MKHRTYTLLLWLCLPWLLLRLRWRARTEPGYRAHWGERFGRYSQAVAGHVVWVHAVSVGETRGAEPLIRALLAQGRHLVLTHMTPGGRAAARQLFTNDIEQGRLVSVYLPYDYAFTVRRFLRHFRPRLGLIMETEVWPTLLKECQRLGVPVVLANARLSQKSAARGQRLGELMQQSAARLSLALAQTQADAERLKSLGVPRVAVTGNLKFDVEVKAEAQALGQRWRQQIGSRPVLLLASTREAQGRQEEQEWLDAMKRVQWLPNLLLVLVPRHPQRFQGVAELAQRQGWRVQRRSSGAALAAATQVWVGDSMGELGAYYTLADLAFVGGSLVPLGGQNLIEACAYGCPVLMGPSTFNFAQAAHDAVQAGAVRLIDSAEQGAQCALQLLAAPSQLLSMRHAAEQFSHLHRGATARSLEYLKRTALINSGEV